MTDSMNFGPEWLRNLSSDGSTGGGTGGVRYQLAEYRYGREDMLALYDKTLRPPNSLCSFTTLYSEQPLPPLAFQTSASEDDRVWQSRAPPVGASRGRGGSLERGGGRGNRGRGTYQPYGRSSGGFETGGGWGNSEQSDWSPRKDYNARSSSVDNWRRSRGDEDDGWRSNSTRISEKWGRQTSWRDGDANEERGPGQERNRGWHDGSRASMQRRTWDDENLPEWANENLGEGGGTFDASGAFHGSDDELVDSRPPESDKKESPLQKSSSQHNIQVKKHPALLPSSKSSASLSKPMDSKREMESPDNNVKEPPESKQFGHKESKQKKAVDPMKEHVRDDCELVMQNESNGISSDTSISNRVDEDFDRLQEDLVLKIVEEPSKLSHVNNASQMDVSMSSQPPPNLAPPVQDKWYYQDPQGDLQGPFSSSEMAEWFRAGYFTVSLLVRRQCDERFYMLGDLVTLCNGNPFQTSLRIAPLKNENPNDLLKVQIMQQLGMRQAPARVYPPNEAWRGMPNIAQRDMLPQQLLPQPPQQIPPVDLSFISAPNPLLALFQMHQAKAVPEKTPNTIATDPLQAFVQQMGGLQSLENRLPTNVGLPANAAIPPPSVLSAGNNVLPVTNNIQGGNANLTNSTLTGIGLPGNLQGDTLPTAMPGLHNPIPPNNMPMQNLQNLPGGLPSNLQNSLPPKTSHAKGDNLNDNNAIKNLLRQIATQSQPQQPSRDALWQQNQFVPPQINSQWQQQSQQQPPPPDVPISMWDMQLPPLETALPLSSNAVTPSEDTAKPKEPIKPKETKDNKEEKKKKEIEEKAAKKESEEKRKQEQRKQEAEKKAAEEKRKRDEERIKKELEKARKEAEEKRLRELEEKRKLKEQRKAEEEAKKKAEELKKLEEQEKKEAKEKEEQLKKQMEAAAKHENQIKMPKAAPWCQSNNAHGTSLAEIQKAEREKRAQEAALVQKVKQEQETIVEKPSNTQFSWANKPIAPRQVKSLAEIQAEEQEKLAKQQVSEARLAQQQKEKEIPIAVNQSIWNGQNLTWANNTSQWSNAGFWDGTISEKVANNKPATGQKTTTATAVVTNQQQQQKQVQKQPVKNKVVKKEPETVKTLNNNNNSVNDEFINWCTKSLTALKTTVDIPTFVNFLRDIESALDVREYCRDYLGDSPATHQFAAQFLEKRRSFKPKVNAHKDDMCTPAPAITPSSHSDFQEVKSKGKKTKKSKMLKVDSRILGFNVTASHDRINVGDRDYVDN